METVVDKDRQIKSIENKEEIDNQTISISNNKKHQVALWHASMKKERERLRFGKSDINIYSYPQAHKCMYICVYALNFEHL